MGKAGYKWLLHSCVLCEGLRQNSSFLAVRPAVPEECAARNGNASDPENVAAQAFPSPFHWKYSSGIRPCWLRRLAGLRWDAPGREFDVMQDRRWPELL